MLGWSGQSLTEQQPLVHVPPQGPLKPAWQVVVEQVPLIFRHGDLRSLFAQARRAPALIAMVMRVQNPFDVFDADALQMIGKPAWNLDDGACSARTPSSGYPEPHVRPEIVVLKSPGLDARRLFFSRKEPPCVSWPR